MENPRVDLITSSTTNVREHHIVTASSPHHIPVIKTGQLSTSHIHSLQLFSSPHHVSAIETRPTLYIKFSQLKKHSTRHSPSLRRFSHGFSFIAATIESWKSTMHINPPSTPTIAIAEHPHNNSHQQLLPQTKERNYSSQYLQLCIVLNPTKSKQWPSKPLKRTSPTSLPP
jgi:hypothetical protein